ncbi:VOC family protein [Lapillicoccus sp.]|uniref:VOC family protein n=1 Tax=Lapillicoccus sp. TaxID=1909287 RepID=UPI0027C61543|nr:4a-hydroxytetrahydrobiopterin dehydratase [Actinomycetota bacterium]
MSETPQTMTRQESTDAMPGWRRILRRMHLTVPTEDFATALTLVDRIGQVAEEQQHHPDIDLRYGRVHVVTSSHDVGGVTNRDVALGTAVSAIVAEMGLTPDNARITELEIAIDAMDIPAVLPFWAAVLGWDVADDEVTDPDTIGPNFWFQQMDEARPQRNRIHIDVTVPHDEAQARMAKAIEAGGRLVSDAEAPSFWILADPEGNEACICTWQARD